MIQLEVIEQTPSPFNALRPNVDHFSVRADEPMRIEITRHDGQLVVTVYRGVEDNEDDEPVGCYDSANGVNKSWEDYA